MTVQPAACTPAACSTIQAPAPFARAIAKIRDAFAALHDVQWRAPWDEPGKRWVNLR
jgi:hypothetical protein